MHVTPWTPAHQAPPSMGFPRQEYWSGLPFPSPGDPSDLGIEPVSPTLVGGFLTTEAPGKPLQFSIVEGKLFYTVLYFTFTLTFHFSSVAQSCLTLCDPMYCSLPGSCVHGTLPARILEWVAISFSSEIFPTQGLNPGILCLLH